LWKLAHFKNSVYLVVKECSSEEIFWYKVNCNNNRDRTVENNNYLCRENELQALIKMVKTYEWLKFAQLESFPLSADFTPVLCFYVTKSVKIDGILSFWCDVNKCSHFFFFDVCIVGFLDSSLVNAFLGVEYGGNVAFQDTLVLVLIFEPGFSRQIWKFYR